jgi:hypothetical protein
VPPIADFGRIDISFSGKHRIDINPILRAIEDRFAHDEMVCSEDGDRLVTKRNRMACHTCCMVGPPEGDSLVLSGPSVATLGPVIRVELGRFEALELLGMRLAHLNEAETTAETSPRVPLLMAIRNKLALGSGSHCDLQRHRGVSGDCGNG